MNFRRLFAKNRTTSQKRMESRRSMTVETLDTRALLTGDIGIGNFATGESVMRFDVNRDSFVTSNDALRVINEIDRGGVREVRGIRQAEAFDSNADGWVTAADALVVVNHVGRHGNTEIGLRDLLGDRRQLVSEEQRDNFRQLFTDLNALRRESDVTPQQIMELLGSVATAFEDANLPSQESVQQLVDTVTAAVDDGELSAEEIDQVSSDLGVVLESANISQEEAQALAQNLRSVFEASGVDREDVGVILGDLQAIVTEFRDGDQGISDVQRENIRDLLSDLRSIAADSDVTVDQLQQLRSNIRAALENATQPDLFLVLGLARDARAAFADGELSDEEQATLSSGLDAVLESASISQSDRDLILADIEALIDSSGITIDDLQTIAQDLIQIRGEFAGNRPRFGGGFRDLIGGFRS
ncbi:MAG: dockerin type I domain-containing protein [Planctomycetota bacterium]